MNKILKHPAILIIILTIIPTTILMLFLSDTPIISLYSFFTGPFSNIYSFGNMLNRTTPLLLTSLGAFIALKSNSFNLGGEGQVYLGATITGILLNNFSDTTTPIALILVIITAISASGMLTFISAWLELKHKVNTLISTYLLSMATLHVCNYLITEPFLKANSNILTTESIDKVFWLQRILRPSSLSTGFILAIVLVLIISFIIKNTIWGYEFTISGRNRDFSKSMGINSKKYKILGLTISGILHGVAGVLLVIGSHHAAIIGFHSNLGWNGLSAALLAGSNPVMVIASSLFYSYLDAGSSYATIVSDVTIELSDIIKSLLFFVISSRIIKEQLIKRSIK